MELADQSQDRSEFLRLLAAELRETLRVALVAVESVDWPAPMMLVAEERMSQAIDRTAIRSLLETAARSPIACDVPATSPSTGDGSDEVEWVRGIRVELNCSPDRAAVLLVYPQQLSPSASDQLRDLKTLQAYAQSTREVICTLPLDDGGSSLREGGSLETALTVSSATSVLGNRQSLRLFHRDLDLGATAYRIANESRRLLGCDRVTVLVPRGGRHRALAISGVSVVDSRSNSVRSAERLSSSVAVMSRPLVLPSDQPLPPQIQEPLDHYLDETGVMSAIVLPLHSPDAEIEREGIEEAEIDPFHGSGELLGVMILEYFSGSAPPSVGPPMALVAAEATLSLRNAIEHRKVFGLPVMKAIGGVVQSSRFPMIAVAMLCAAAMVVAAAFIPIEHHVIATGTVQPQSRRQVFASVDGVVTKVHVTDGQKVEAGQPLFELENAELESRAETLAGEIQTASRRLASVRSVRLASEADAAQKSRLALEERQLESELANLRAQQEVVRSQQHQLTVTSPIAGTVVGWQLLRRLGDRPVSRGNLLVAIVDHHGPWSLRLHVPDRDAGPVLQAAEQDASLPIQFAVATQPQASYAATLQSIATAARLDESGEQVIDATAMVAVDDSADSRADRADRSFDSFRASDVRVGADVTAKIACGKRSVLGSWFADVIDFTHRNVLFYFR